VQPAGTVSNAGEPKADRLPNGSRNTPGRSYTSKRNPRTDLKVGPLQTHRKSARLRSGRYKSKRKANTREGLRGFRLTAKQNCRRADSIRFKYNQPVFE